MLHQLIYSVSIGYSDFTKVGLNYGKIVGSSSGDSNTQAEFNVLPILTETRTKGLTLSYKVEKNHHLISFE